MPKNGLQVYYEQKIEQIDVTIREKQQNVLRLEAQRNDWNNKGIFNFFRKLLIFSVRFIKEELQKLSEHGSYVGEVVKVMGKKKVLVKVENYFSFDFLF